MEDLAEEERRVDAVERLGLLDQPEEERFLRIVRLVRRFFRANAAAITLLDRKRAYCLAGDGVQKREAKRSDSICSQVAHGKVPLVTASGYQDAVPVAVPQLLANLGLSFYAGVPILTPEGYAVGVLCITDHIPRTFSRRELESLADFAAIVEDEILYKRTRASNRELIGQVEKLKVQAYLDPLTNCWNRAAIFDILHREVDRSNRTGQPLCTCMMDLDRFKRINDTYGHRTGDYVLEEACRRVRASIRPYDSLGRYGGEEFLLVYPETDLTKAETQANRVREAIGSAPFSYGDMNETITVSIGLTQLQPKEDPNDFVARADAGLYSAKQSGRNKVVAVKEN